MYISCIYCSVLQCVAVCRSVLQCIAGVFAVRCSALQCAAVCRSVLQCVAVYFRVSQHIAVCCSVLQWEVTCQAHWREAVRARGHTRVREHLQSPLTPPIWTSICIHTEVREHNLVKTFDCFCCTIHIFTCIYTLWARKERFVCESIREFVRANDCHMQIQVFVSESWWAPSIALCLAMSTISICTEVRERERSSSWARAYASSWAPSMPISRPIHKCIYIYRGSWSLVRWRLWLPLSRPVYMHTYIQGFVSTSSCVPVIALLHPVARRQRRRESVCTND